MQTQSHPALFGNGSAASRDLVAAGLVRAGERPAAVVAFEQETVAFFVEAADLLGVPRSVAAIYAVVFASAEPLCFSDIEARLELSKGSVSQGLRFLREMGAFKVIAREGDRREFFSPDIEMRKLIQRFLEQRLQRQLEAGKSRLRRLSAQVEALPAAEREELRRRLRRLRRWHDRTRALLPVAKTFLNITKL